MFTFVAIECFETPMAKDDLTGNLPTENLVAYFDEMKEDIDLNRENLREAMKVAGRVFPG